MMTLQLKRFEFRGASGGPRILITGGVHGDEFEPIAAIRQLIDQFESHSPELDGFQGHVTFIPIVNESAFLRGHRCADDNLDLARTCPGRVDGSITEQVAFALSSHIREADFYIDLHTGGTELCVFPLAGYMMHSNESVLQTQRRMARAFNLPIIWGTSANLDGRSLSVARDANIPAIYCEYLGSATCVAEGVDAYVTGCLNVMSDLGMFDRPAAASRIEHIVENPQPNSGHMQISNPSPATGYFEPVVKLGGSIKRSEPLGIVYPLEGGLPVTIESAQTGKVIVLRTFPRVRAGESVGVVLEIPTESS